jgi:hypothetical protein
MGKSFDGCSQTAAGIPASAQPCVGIYDACAKRGVCIRFVFGDCSPTLRAAFAESSLSLWRQRAMSLARSRRDVELNRHAGSNGTRQWNCVSRAFAGRLHPPVAAKPKRSIK